MSKDCASGVPVGLFSCVHRYDVGLPGGEPRAVSGGVRVLFVVWKRDGINMHFNCKYEVGGSGSEKNVMTMAVEIIFWVLRVTPVAHC